jgi:hypothetical protein
MFDIRNIMYSTVQIIFMRHRAQMHIGGEREGFPTM